MNERATAEKGSWRRCSLIEEKDEIRKMKYLPSRMELMVLRVTTQQLRAVNVIFGKTRLIADGVVSARMLLWVNERGMATALVLEIF